MKTPTRIRIAVVALSAICAFGSTREAETDGAESTELPPTKNRPGVVKIATIGSLPPSVDADATSDEIVERVIAHWKGRIAQVIPDTPDLIVVPENCDRPIGMSGGRALAYYRERGDRVRDYFAAVAKENKCYVTYPAVRLMDDETWRNSIVLFDRDGEVAGIYDKNHPTNGEIEEGILPGEATPIIECDFGRVALTICFDLNFDRLRLTYAKKRPDLVIFSSMYHGGMMQPYWAYSCRSHFVGAIERKCPSEMYSPLGERIASNTNYFDFAVATINLDCELAHLDYNWDRLKSLKEKYGRAVTISDPGKLGSVLVSSSHPQKCVNEMLKEFNIESLDAYLQRSLDFRDEHAPSHAAAVDESSALAR